jgi:hypothetical protein
MTVEMRNTDATYRDPLEIVWVEAARRMGICVKRSTEVFASWDGCETLFVGTPETLDPDDSLAQMIFHEVCHALCEWPDGLSKPDWGLESDNPDHRVREHACLRLQAALAEPYGLRTFFAATTVFRKYYDRIPGDPLDDDGDPAVPIAQAAVAQLRTGAWSDPLDKALQATALIAAVVHDFTDESSLWNSFQHASDQRVTASRPSFVSTDQSAS